MKILVTGSKGFIGTRLVQKLGQRNHVPVTWDLMENEDIFDDLFEDILKTVDIVVHLAAKTNVQESFLYPADYFHVNITGTVRIAALCAKRHKKLIYPSSAAIYDIASSPYALSKYIAEEVIEELGHINPYVILRLFNVYSSTPKSDSVFYRFFKEYPIVVNGRGDQIRDFIHVDDVCNIIIDSFENRYNNLTFDVGRGRGYSIRALASYFERYHNKKVIFGDNVKEVFQSIAETRILDKLYKNSYITDVENDIKNMGAFL